MVQKEFDELLQIDFGDGNCGSKIFYVISEKKIKEFYKKNKGFLINHEMQSLSFLVDGKLISKTFHHIDAKRN